MVHMYIKAGKLLLVILSPVKSFRVSLIFSVVLFTTLFDLSCCYSYDNINYTTNARNITHWCVREQRFRRFETAE